MQDETPSAIDVSMPILLRTPKRCSCGLVHISAGRNYRYCSASHLWFQCSCNNTLVQVSEAFEAARARGQAAMEEYAKAQMDLARIVGVG